MIRLPFVGLLILSSCRSTSPGPLNQDRRKPVGWVMVTRTYADLEAHRTAGAARVEGGASVVVLEPLFVDEEKEGRVSGECPHALCVVRAPEDVVPVGGVADVEIAIDGPESVTHELSVTPVRPGITLLTPAAMTLRGTARASIRFTGASAGEGGVLIQIVRCDSLK